MGDSSADILTITPSMLDWLGEYELEDLFDYFDPDGVFVVQDADGRLSYQEVQELVGDRICFYPEKEQKRIRHIPINGIDFAVIDGVENVDVAEQVEQRFVSDEEDYAYLITTDIDVKIDTSELSASLENQEEYRTHTGKTKRPYVYMSGALPSHYRQNWGDMIVQGARPKEVRGGLLLPRFTCYADGRINIKNLRSTNLGLRAIRDVGRKTAEKLVDHGYQTRSDVSRATRSDLREIYGIGEKKGNSIWYHSRALENDTIKRRANNPVPGDQPVFIDIATDGFTPTVIWYIVAYDSKTNTYETFLAKNPDAKGDVIRSFITWYAAGRQSQTMISWRGWESTYRHLQKFIREHASKYETLYERANKRDLYYWAEELENAVLPGRTEDIVDHARTLGTEFPEVGINEQYIMNSYREWMNGGEDEPEWDLIRQYYKNRIRALITVYNELSI